MVKTGEPVFLSYGERRKGLGEKAPRGGKMKFGESKKYFRGMFSAVLLCLTVSAARAWIYDPSKPLIYEMRIAFETDKWINMYSTATVLSKSDNSVAFRVVADSTVTPTYQLVVTTQGNVGIGTANPAYLLDLNGTANGKQIRINTSGSNGPSIGFNQDGTQHAVVGLAGAFQATTNRDLGFLSDDIGGNMSFFTNGDVTSPKVTILSGGNVGIGTTAPAQKLEVAGNIYASGTPTYGAQLYTTSNAASDSNGNESNAVTGWSVGYTGTTLTAVAAENGVSPNTGSYQFHVGGSVNGARSDYPFSVVSGKRYVVTLNAARYQGQVYHLFYVATTNSGDNYGYAINGSQSLTETPYTAYTYTFVAPLTGTVYLSLRVGASSNPAIITYVDNISIKEETGGSFYGNNGYYGGNLTVGGSGNNYFAGNVGIGTTTAGYNLTVNGTAWVTGGEWSGSDARWKKNVSPLSGSLDKILKLRGVSFEWRADEFPAVKFSPGGQIGFIAQEVKKVVPEIVTTDNSGYLGISYEKLVPVLTEALKEQQRQIEKLKAANSKLESANERLESRITALEKNR